MTDEAAPTAPFHFHKTADAVLLALRLVAHESPTRKNKDNGPILFRADTNEPCCIIGVVLSKFGLGYADVAAINGADLGGVVGRAGLLRLGFDLDGTELMSRAQNMADGVVAPFIRLDPEWGDVVSAAFGDATTAYEAILGEKPTDAAPV